jgi:hypothetical protein
VSTWSEQSVSGWLGAFGIFYNSADPLQPLYDLIKANTPSLYRGPTWDAYEEACLRANGILYFKTTPGDCGTAVVNTSKYATDLQIQGQIGQSLAAVTGGISSIIAGIAEIFTEAHATAVANEQTVNCAIANFVNSVAPQIESLFFTGKLTPAQAYQAYQAMVTQAIDGLGSVSKQDNWGYGTQQILRNMQTLRGYVYEQTPLPAALTYSDITESLGEDFSLAKALAASASPSIANSASSVASSATNAIGSALGSLGASGLLESPVALILIAGVILLFVFSGDGDEESNGRDVTVHVEGG